jgi:hypothetical protein
VGEVAVLVEVSELSYLVNEHHVVEGGDAAKVLVCNDPALIASAKPATFLS